MSPTFDVAHQAGPILVTVAYVLLYYVFQIHIVFVKNRLKAEYAERGEKFDRYFGQDRHMLAADRVQLNTLEHMPPFLVLLWLNAIFVGPLGATIAGGAYVLGRALYPVMMGGRLGRGVRGSILFSTAIGYAVLAYYSIALVAVVVQAWLG